MVCPTKLAGSVRKSGAGVVPTGEVASSNAPMSYGLIEALALHCGCRACTVTLMKSDAINMESLALLVAFTVTLVAAPCSAGSMQCAAVSSTRGDTCTAVQMLASPLSKRRSRRKTVVVVVSAVAARMASERVATSTGSAVGPHAKRTVRGSQANRTAGDSSTPGAARDTLTVGEVGCSRTLAKDNSGSYRCGVITGRFGMAVHALAVLAQNDDGASSAYVAGSINTHAVALRRVLSELTEAGLVEARVGRGGGYRLARDAKRISLADVYRVIEPEGPLAPCPADPNPWCPIGSGIRAAFEAPARHARQALLASLEKQTVSDVAQAALRAGSAGAHRKS